MLRFVEGQREGAMQLLLCGMLHVLVWKGVDYSGRFWKEACGRFQSIVLHYMWFGNLDGTVEKVLL